METDNLNNKNVLGPIPGNDPVPVKDTKVSPYKFVGLLRVAFPNGKVYIGTGTVIAKDAEKESFYVLTCAHILYAVGNGGKAVKVEFIRGYNDPDKPFEPIQAVSWYYPAAYPPFGISEHNEKIVLENKIGRENEINLDYGVVKLKSAVNSVDGFPEIVVKTSQELQDLAVQINGYGWFEEKMSHAQGLIKEVGNEYLRYPISTNGGTAGAAIVKGDNKEIVGIQTRIHDYKLNQGVRITERVKSEILGWML